MSRKLPTIAEVASELLRIAKWYADDCDVRLRVHDGDWQVLWGSADYDQDHRGHWGASYLPEGKLSKRAARDIARDLLAQVRDAQAGAVTTWADGFGRWYAAVPPSSPTSERKQARSLILAELQARGMVEPRAVRIERAETTRDGLVVYREADNT